MKKTILIIMALILLSATALHAHNTYVAKEGNDFVVMNGHHGKSDPYKPEFVKGVKAYDASGKDIQVKLKPQETRVLLAPAQAPALVAFIFSAGPRVKTAEGWKNVSKRQVKDYLASRKSVKYVKQINQWNQRFSKPMGSKMELVPLKNPLALRVGDKLAIQALYDGKPLAGAMVRAEGVAKGSLKTDPNGKAEIVIKKSGLNVVKISRNTPTPKDPDADNLSETANLVFAVK